MSTGAGDGTLWEISQSIANNEAYYLQGLSGVDNLAGFSAVVPKVIAGVYPYTIGFYMYTKPTPYTIQSAPIGGTGPIRIMEHHFRRMLLVGGRDDNMETVIDPQMRQWVDIYDRFLTAHKTCKEPDWSATHTILPNVWVVPTVANGHVYQNKTGQTFVTGGSQPSFPTGTGATVADGTGTWTEIRAPWGAVTNEACVENIQPFSINLNEQLAHMGIAYDIKALAFPNVTVGP